jgi:hypothetical protein
MAYLTISERKKNIRKLSTKELKTYKTAYNKGQIYAFAFDEAQKELARRKMGIEYKSRARPQQQRPQTFMDMVMRY